MENQGLDNTLIGFLLGFFGGCLGLIIAMVIGGPSTKKGGIAGFVVSIAIVTCLGFTGAVLQVVLGNM
ncbi:MAG: hypothetical protein ACI8PZ_001198 [Myxococcota bacterium]|jgi:hypothetical protein